MLLVSFALGFGNKLLGVWTFNGSKDVVWPHVARKSSTSARKAESDAAMT